jgi:kinesin family protein 1
VEVQDLKNGATHYWSLDKLRQRLELMREMYHQEAELSPNSPQHQGGNQGGGRGGGAVAENMSGNDPFYDRFPWFRLIGRSFIHISNLFYPVTLVHKAAIVSERGDVKGYLRITVQAVSDDEQVPCGVKQSGNAKIKFSDKDYCCRRRDKFRHLSKSSLLLPHTALDELRVVEGERTELNHCGIKELEVEADSVTLTGGEDWDPFADINEAELPPHLKIGSEFTFRVSIAQAAGLSADYADVFCQFNFLHRFDEAFSTEPMKNVGKGQPLVFNHVQNVSSALSLNLFLFFV